MFGSIFTRLLVTYLLITVIVVSVLAFVASIIYKDAIFQAKRSALEAAAVSTAELTEAHLEGRTSAEALSSAVDALGVSTGAMIYSLRLDPEDFKNGSALTAAGIGDDYVVGSMEAILGGETVYLEKEYSDAFDMHVLFAGHPLRLDGQTIGAVLIFCPVSNIDRALSNLNLMLWLAAVAVILLSSPLIYLNARHISRPIREMEAMARRIAPIGDLKFASITQKDEIAMLSAAFYEMRQRLDEVEKMRRELIADVSHELRTPLTSISGFVQAILDGLIGPDEQEQYMKLIREESDRLIRLTSDLLELARIQSGNIRLDIEEIDLAAIAGAVAATEKITAHQKDITLAAMIPHGMTVMADGERLKQILLNLVGNALKYAPDCGNVTIKAKMDGAYAVIMVEDNGEGIPPEDLPYIFEKFYRSDKVCKPEDGSAGLGLSIAKHLVELQGGTIKAESTQGTGTVVSFTLPLAEPKA